MKKGKNAIVEIKALGFPWETPDPFLFCVYHADAYPKGNENLGPDASLEGRNLGNDFVLKDGWRMYHGTVVPGFPVHPHRGFETITVVRRGIVDHSDSMGGAGRYGHGDVQWMTAGRGIQHCEMFPLLNRDKENPLELFQIWLNLPGDSKLVDPFYRMLWAEMIPHYHYSDEQGKEVRVEIIAGSLNGLTAPDPAPDSWAAERKNDLAIWYIRMEPGATWSIPTASITAHRTLYYFEGSGVKIENNIIASNRLVQIIPNQKVEIINDSSVSRFLMLQGKPIGEPVASYGPFVMNTRQEIQQTYIDYQNTRFGGWPWPRYDQVHSAEKDRFALYSDGKEEFPEPGES